MQPYDGRDAWPMECLRMNSGQIASRLAVVTSKILPRKSLRTVTIRVSAMVKKVPSRLKSVAHRSP